MRLVYYDDWHPGVVVGDRIADLNNVFAGARPPYKVADISQVAVHPQLRQHAEAVVRIAEERIAEKKLHPFIKLLATVKLRAPVRLPGKILCLGLNFPDPANPDFKPEYPILFVKTLNTINYPGMPINLPAVSEKVGYEGELAVIIGKPGRDIPEDQALSYVAGYTIANDVGAKDLEARSSQWTTGKILDTFTPVGPYLVTLDEITDPAQLTIKTYLNDELVQDGNTGGMFFNVPFTIHYLSQLCTLHPGDVILMGSPKSVGDKPMPQQFLKHGDVIRIKIDGLGELSNPVEGQKPNG